MPRYAVVSTGMQADVYDTARMCSKYARDRIGSRKHTNPLTLFQERAHLESVALDVLVPLPKTSSGKRYVLVMVDRFSKFCLFRALRTDTAEKVAQAFCEDWVFYLPGAKDSFDRKWTSDDF